MKISSCARTLSWPTYSASVPGLSERSTCSSCGEAGRAEIMRSGSTLIGVEVRACDSAGALEREFHSEGEHLHLELVRILPLGAQAPVLREAVSHPEPIVQFGFVALAAAGGRSNPSGFLLGPQKPELAEHGELRADLEAADRGYAIAVLIRRDPLPGSSRSGHFSP